MSGAVKRLFDIQSLITRAQQKLAMGDLYGWTEIFEYAKELETLAAEQSHQKLQPPIELKATASTSSRPATSKKPAAGRGRGGVD